MDFFFGLMFYTSIITASALALLAAFGILGASFFAVYKMFQWFDDHD